jgi:prefoldin subunit 5
MNAEQLEQIKRHFDMATEALRSDIRRIAEGHVALHHELQEHHGEIREEFKEVRAFTQLSFSQLDQHIRVLETDLTTLKTCIDQLKTSRN